MSSTSATNAPKTDPRYTNVDAQKLSGATYTPLDFATFVAQNMVREVNLPNHGTIRILDPAVGDGALLDALIRCLPSTIHNRLEIYGYDINPEAVLVATERLTKEFPKLRVCIEARDFLKYILAIRNDNDLFSNRRPDPFHLVIANPPYVRTQILGAEQAQSLSQSFGLTGRIDLYHPFILGISRVLAADGVTGVITSNRFMTTKSGKAIRRALLSDFNIIRAWDFGDTKLFDAAVLPSVLIAKGATDTKDKRNSNIELSSIYETNDASNIRAEDAFIALTHTDDTVTELSDGRRFRVRHGVLDNGGDPEGLWRLATRTSNAWLASVTANTWKSFREIGKIRVGVKSTADKVFIRNDWDTLPDGPPELLRPLVTRHFARRFRAALPSNAKNVKQILYPHEVINGRRSAVELNRYPKSLKYLEQHRDTLEARTYVIEAGRKWFELWVPHDPSAWSAPKLVFPDISDKPIFWMDTEGSIVNGECYWFCAENEKESELLWLALAIANSTFIESFYDHKFNNKLYAGRRRFITQYVEQFPLPDPSLERTKLIISMTKKIHAITPSDEANSLATELDQLVWNAFGLGKKVT